MSAHGRSDVAPLIRRGGAGSIDHMRVHRRLWFVLALVGSSGAAAAAVEGCSSASSGANGEGLQDGGADTSVEDAPADVVPALDSTTGDGGEAGLDAGNTGDGGCPADGAVPDDLSCTGLYADWVTKTIAPEAVAYTPGLVFWSDGAVKTRWIYLPPGGVIDTTDMDNWVFPVGTKIWKQFALGGQIVETRLIWKTSSSGWTYLDYLWSADGTSAKRFDDGETNVNGTAYEIPVDQRLRPAVPWGRPTPCSAIDLLGTGVTASRQG